ncbi:helicase sen1-like isoform X2 [Belonocnema kinseyi]|uniref:helicase sen1-like isoform X2 n=1 Tax=Belonocnema kinseyi TaxID=2817044 RepID=UPI00143D1B62|nr:helicase sen1-like isoform X2 [Belonocnema kinseyi]
MSLENTDFFLRRIVSPQTEIPKGSDIYLKETKGSGNGVYINGSRIKPFEHITLKDSDIIGIGTPDQTSNDLSKFIYRLHKQVVIDLERDFKKSHNQNLKSEIMQPPRKLLRLSSLGTKTVAVERSPGSYQILPLPSSSSKNSDRTIKFNLNFGVFPSYCKAKNVDFNQTFYSSRTSFSEENILPEICNASVVPTVFSASQDDDIIIIKEVQKDRTHPLTSNLTDFSTETETLAYSKPTSQIDQKKFSESSDTSESDINANEIEMEHDQEHYHFVNSDEEKGCEATRLQGECIFGEGSMRLVEYEDSEDSNGNDNYVVQDVNLNAEREGSDSEMEIDTEKELPIEKSLENIFQESSPLVEQDEDWFSLEKSIDTEINSDVYGFQEDENSNEIDNLNEISRFKCTREKELPVTTLQNNMTMNSKLNGKIPIVVLERLVIKPRESKNQVLTHENRNFVNTPTPVGDKVFMSEKKADELLSHILDWCPSDFKVDNPGKLDPFSFGKINLDRISYETYEEYSKALTSLLLFDVASKVKNATGSVDQSFRFKKCEVIKNSAIKFGIAGKNSYLLDFYLSISGLNQSSLKVPTAGDLLHLEILNKNSRFLVFGYTRNMTSINNLNKGDRLVLAVTTRLLNFNIYSSKIKDLRIITGLNVALNLVEALSEFKSTPLMPMLIKPDAETYRLAGSSNIPLNLVKSEYKQSNAVICIANAVASQKPKVCLIEGAPGTGKTTIISDTIVKLLQSGKTKTYLPPKILVCAKSKAEVDEIVLRLGTTQQNFGTDGAIKMIRVGHSEEDNQQLKNFSLQSLAERHVDLGLRDFFVSKDRKVLGDRDYQEKIRLLDAEYNELMNPSSAIKRNIRETCFGIERSGRNVTEMTDQEISKLVDFAENTLLSEANLIVSTLSMSHSNKIESAFGRRKEISICIIDEATLIPEIEILKPLTFGVKTLVLLGDPFKILVSENNYCGSETQRLDNSLFSRIKANFNRMSNNPIISLDLQYRINERVMFRLNRLIFNGSLKSDCSKYKFPIRPYIVLNTFPHHTLDDETTFITNLILCIVQFSDFTPVEKPVRIGVIIPAGTSKSSIIVAIDKSLSQASVRKRDCVLINADYVSAFKNKEMDIAIVSCMKRIYNVLEPVTDEWLYTAITRVKHSLILYGSFKKLKNTCLLKLLINGTRSGQNYFSIKDEITHLNFQKLILKRSKDRI